MAPGSLPLSTEIYQEGIIIPPLKLVRAGVLNEDLLRLILRNVRTPDERRGDIAAQRAAAAVGIRRLQELVAAFGRRRCWPMPVISAPTANASPGRRLAAGLTGASPLPMCWR